MSTVTHRPRAPRPRRQATWCVAVVCLVAQLLGWGHLIAVEHARCAEHGEVIHVDRAAAPERLTQEHRGDERETSMADADRDDRHADDHCSWLAERRDVVLGVSAHVTCLPTAELASVTPPRSAPPAASIALLRLAPKLSPPTWA